MPDDSEGTLAWARTRSICPGSFAV
jgi:hypothetical protein